LTSGFVDGRITLLYLLAPASLRPGTYLENVVFKLTNAPDGSTPAVSQPVETIVVPHPAIRR